MDALFTANCLFIDERYAEAVEHYQTSLLADPLLFVGASNLAAAYLKLGQYSQALASSQQAIAINPESHFGYLRAGLSLFYREEFLAALTYFEQAEVKKSGSATAWLAKCRAELAKTQVKEEPYTWYQSTDTIFLETRVKSAGQPQVEFRAKGLTIRALTTSGSDFFLDLTLDKEIDAALSTFLVLPNKLELKLKKVEAVNWNWLEPPSDADLSRPSYPTSSKKKTDFNKLDKEAEQEIKKEKPQGEAAMQALFKEIYSNADEDTRRAMIKSFQTSGGTVLSTNWQEVAAKDYETADRPSAPDGQKWEKWAS
jgi:suppressor of G2 allele of SKP1